MTVGEEPCHCTLGDEKTDLLITDSHRGADDALRRAEGPLRFVDDNRWGSRRQVRQSHRSRVGRGLEIRRHRLAQQQCQCVQVERTLAHQLRQRDASAFRERLRLAEIQLGGGAIVEAQLGEPQRLLARGQGLACQRDQFLVRHQGEPVVRHGRDQAGLGGLAALFGSQVLGQGRLAQAGNTAEEIDLPGSERQAGGVDTGGGAAARSGEHNAIVGAVHVEVARILKTDQFRLAIFVGAARMGSFHGQRQLPVAQVQQARRQIGSAWWGE